MSEPVIGLDLGNYYSFPSYIEGMDPQTRRGGVEHELLRRGEGADGIPSVVGVRRRGGRLQRLVGYEAKGMARPQDQLGLLKRSIPEHIESVSIGSADAKVEIRYDEAIKSLVGYIMDVANTRLTQDALSEGPTNQVALAHPVTFNPFDVQTLIELVESVKLEDGRNVEVVGTIDEPAAAALEYLASEGKASGEAQTVLVYDLGAGTFDTTLLTAWPDGKEDAQGRLRYYEVIDEEGLDQLGGNEFTEALRDLVAQKMGGRPTDVVVLDSFLEETERAKLDLSKEDAVYPDILRPGGAGYYDIEVTREEFEEKTRGLLGQTVSCVRSLVGRHPQLQLQRVVLTGGASQMPMVKDALVAEFSGKGIPVTIYKPSQAISFGAARYYLPFANEAPEAVMSHVPHDLGISYIQESSGRTYVETIIPEGVEIPYTPAAYETSYTRVDGQSKTNFDVYEAKRSNPDPFGIEGDDPDWSKIGTLVFEYPSCPKNTEHKSRLRIDNLGVLHVEAHDANDLTRAREAIVSNYGLPQQGRG